MYSGRWNYQIPFTVRVLFITDHRAISMSDHTEVTMAIVVTIQRENLTCPHTLALHAIIIEVMVALDAILCIILQCFLLHDV